MRDMSNTRHLPDAAVQSCWLYFAAQGNSQACIEGVLRRIIAAQMGDEASLSMPQPLESCSGSLSSTDCLSDAIHAVGNCFVNQTHDEFDSSRTSRKIAGNVVDKSKYLRNLTRT